MDYLIALAVCLPIAVLIAIPWTNAIEKRKHDPEQQKHRDGPNHRDCP